MGGGVVVVGGYDVDGAGVVVGGVVCCGGRNLGWVMVMVVTSVGGFYC